MVGVGFNSWGETVCMSGIIKPRTKAGAGAESIINMELLNAPLM